MTTVTLQITKSKYKILDEYLKTYEVDTKKYLQELLDKNLHFLDLEDNYKYCLISKSIYYNNRKISFTKKENQLLKILLFNRNEIVETNDLEDKLWGNIENSLASLRNTVLNIRKKTSESIIKSISGRGYRIDVKNFALIDNNKIDLNINDEYSRNAVKLCSFENYEIDLMNEEIRDTKLNLIIKFTRLERKVLFLLINNHSQYLSLRSITLKFHDSKNSNEQSIRNIISTIRKKTKSSIIENKSSIGYKISNELQIKKYF